METHAAYRPRTSEIPQEPGVYRFRDADQRVIYVGKAKNLRSRLSSYFQDPSRLHHRTATMVATATSVEWTVVSTEVEALHLEFSWIKEFAPRFNVKYRDDKSYPYLAVTLGEEFPRATVMRGDKRKGTKYFGPYTHAWAIRETLDLLLRVFPVRTCTSGVFKRSAAAGRPCLLGYIDKCAAPCVGRVSASEHRQIAEQLCAFLNGDTRRFVREREEAMAAAAQAQNYELAARLRDDVGALTTALEKSVVVLPDSTHADVFGLAGDDLEASVQVFHVRSGRITGQRGWILEREADSDAALIEHLLQQLYGPMDGDRLPHEVLVPVALEHTGPLEEWLRERAGHKVAVRVPQRGDKVALQHTVTRNAEQAHVRHKLTRGNDLTTRSAALQELQDALDLPVAPLRIEGFDVSHIQGTNVVASMVVFEDGLPRPSEYRSFTIAIPESGTIDDTAAMRQVLSRRFARAAADDAADTVAATATGGAGDLAHAKARPPGSRGAARFAYPPHLIVVDGGKPQVQAAQEVVLAAGQRDVTVIGLAKRLEEIWTAHSDFPLVLPRTSDALFLLQRVRDESHRRAIRHHRKKRSATMTSSLLDGVPGLGPVKRQALLAAFGSVKKLRAATQDQLSEVPGIGPTLAAAVLSHLAGQVTAPAVNVTTGEILDDEPSGVGSSPVDSGDGVRRSSGGSQRRGEHD